MKQFYNEDKILRELEEGTIYTTKQILNFIRDNRDAIVLSNNSYMEEQSKSKYTVVQKIEKYLHKQSENGYRVYRIPNTVTVVYELKEV